VKYRHFTELHTDFDAEECRRRLVGGVDPEKRTIFSLSGYKGSKPVIRWFDGYQFYLHKRRYWHNSFAPLFFGNLVSRDHGTTIEGYFDMPRFAKTFMRIWTAGVVLLGSPIFALTLVDLLKGSHHTEGSAAVGLLVPPGMVLFGLFMPKVGLWLSRNEESFIVEFLRENLLAGNAVVSTRVNS
jgi:hypothetical protein